MRAYLLTTLVLFAALFLAHAARVALEGVGALGEPIFVITSLLALIMVAWAARLLRRPAGAVDLPPPPG